MFLSPSSQSATSKIAWGVVLLVCGIVTYVAALQRYGIAACICARVYTSSYKRAHMSTTLSVRIDTETKRRLEALAKRARRSKSFLAAEASAAFVEAESWQLDAIQTGIRELDEGRDVPHKDVAGWLRSWGRKRERRAPRV